MAFSEKDRFDSCMKQADFFCQRVYNRQQYQWKVTLGLWALIAAGVSVSWEKSIALSPLVVAAVPLMYGFLWLRPVAFHNLNDQISAAHFRNQAEIILTKRASTTMPKPPKMTCKDWEWWLGFFCNWAHFFEFTTTASLMTAAFFILRQHPAVKPVCPP